MIVGGEGDDKIISSDDSTDQRNHDDGGQDIIFCGPGHDEVWFSMHEGDTTIDCELTH